MNFKQSLHYLNSFINYEKTPPASHAELNLERMRHGLEVLNHPDSKFFPILIAGTVGKGSTGYFLEQILASAKISAGFYHSPHVDDVRERVRVRGQMVSEKGWAAELTHIQKFLKQKPFPRKLGQPTFFEILTLLAIFIFSKEKLRIGIFEIGMGGRLDATNVLNAPLCILTKIDLDHQAFLGNTIQAIAREKAGIIKFASHVIVSPQDPSVLKVIKNYSAGGAVLGMKQRGLTPMVSSQITIARPTSFQPGLSGKFQKQNAGNAAAAARALRDHFDFPVSNRAIQNGLEQKQWPGRMEVLKKKGRTFLMDAAHNPAGCSALIQALSAMKKKPAYLFFSALRDKESAVMLSVLAKLAVPVFVAPVQHPRAKGLANLAAEAEAYFDRIIPAKDTAHACRLLIENTRPGEQILVTGSFYLLGEFRKAIA